MVFDVAVVGVGGQRQNLPAGDDSIAELGHQAIQNCIQTIDGIGVVIHQGRQGVDVIPVGEVQTVGDQTRTEIEPHIANLNQGRTLGHEVQGVSEGGQVGWTIEEDEKHPSQLIGIAHASTRGIGHLNDGLRQTDDPLVHGRHQCIELSRSGLNLQKYTGRLGKNG